MNVKRLLACLLTLALMLGMASISTVSVAANEPPQSLGAMLDAYLATYGNAFNLLTGNAALRDQARADAAAIVDTWSALPSDAARDAAVGPGQTQTLIAVFSETARLEPGFPASGAAVQQQFAYDFMLANSLLTPNMITGRELGRILHGGAPNSAGLTFTDNATTFTGANAANIQAFEDIAAQFRALPSISFYVMLAMSTAAPHVFIAQGANLSPNYLVRVFNLQRFYLMATQGITDAAQATFATFASIAQHFGLFADVEEGLAVLAQTRAGFNTLFGSIASTFGLTETCIDMDVSGLAGVQQRWDTLRDTSAYFWMISVWAQALTGTNANHTAGPAIRVGTLANGNPRNHQFSWQQVRQHLDGGSPGGLYALGTIDVVNPNGMEVARVIRAVEGNPLTDTLKNQYMDWAPATLPRTSAVNRRLDAIRPDFAPEGRPDRDATPPDASGWARNRSGNWFQRARTGAQLAVLGPLADLVLDLTLGERHMAIYTNETINALVMLNAALFGVLQEEISQLSGLEQGVILGIVNTTHNTNMSVEVLANLLFEDEYADIVAYLRSIQHAGNGGWDAFDSSNSALDWGVVPGCRESFTTAVIAALRPVARLLTHGAGREQPLAQSTSVGQLLDMVAGDGSWTDDGHYELSFIPLLESLNARGVMTADELNYAVFAANRESADPRLFQDVLTTALIEPLLNVVEDVLNDPLNTLLDIIPNFAYFVTQGRLDSFFNDWQLRFATDRIDIPLNSADEILELLLGAVFGENFDMPEIDWEFIATLGTRATRPTAGGTHVYQTYIQANRVDVLREVFGSVMDLIANETNADALAAMLNSAATGQDITSLVSAIQRRNPFTTIFRGIRLAIRISRPAPAAANAALCVLGTQAIGLGMSPEAAGCPCTQEPAQPDGSIGTWAAIWRFVQQTAINFWNFFGDLFTGRL